MSTYRDKLLPAAARALEGGAELKSPVSVHWDVAGGCEAPVTVGLVGRLDDRRQAARGGAELPLFLDLETRCRACSRCLEARRKLWTARAVIETRESARCWFGTLTVNPDNRMFFLNQARASCARQGVDLDTLPEPERIRRLYVPLSAELTRYLKRVRKQSEASIRVLFVAELHKSGDLHLHCLIHEQSLDRPCRKAVLRDQWRVGFTKWKLVTELAQARYVCKYLSKSMLVRVRASVLYGRRPYAPVGHSEETPQRENLTPLNPSDGGA